MCAMSRDILDCLKRDMKRVIAWKTSIVWKWALLALGYIESLVSLVWMFDYEFDFQTSFGLFQLEIETLI